MKKVLFPAIDIIDGKCVRLLRGEYSEEKKYNDDPVAQALDFQEAGVSWIHLVDLDAARTGLVKNGRIIEKIASRLDVPIQVGGGVRTLKTAKTLYDCGIERIVLGTAAVENPTLIEKVSSFGRVAIGVDLREGKVAVNGWQTSTEISFSELSNRFEKTDIDGYIVTHIERDGTMEGPEIDSYRDLLGETTKDVIASGGVGSIIDLENLSNLTVDGKSLNGVIVGRALYEGSISLEQALKAFEK